MIKNLQQVNERIKKAINDNELIILYGDSDTDGVCSVIMLEEAIKLLGGKTQAYFPSYIKDGHGLNDNAVDYFSSRFTTGLIILLDCGIGNIKEVALAKKRGFSVAIVDHHQPIHKLPPADIIVAPKQQGDTSGKGYLSNGGLSWKLIEDLFSGEVPQRNSFLELAALSTIADMMPMEGENIEIVAEGLKAIKKSNRPGIKAFDNKAQSIIEAGNVSSVINHRARLYRLLKADNMKEAKRLASLIQDYTERRHQRSRNALSKIEDTTEPLIFQGSSSWDIPSLGGMASKLVSRYNKPVFLYVKDKDSIRGSMRCPQNINGLKILQACEQHFIGYGGHPPAAGFRAKADKVEEIKRCLIKKYEEDNN
jgi:single-stranded-DNA-specific exonuclease